VERARQAHPGAPVLAHPECRAEVLALADYVGSTTGIMAYAKGSDAREFIIGTENSIVEHLQFDCPEKSFYPLAVSLTCMDMKVTTLMDVLRCLSGAGGEEIVLPQQVMDGAGRCIRRMMELGG
jgi:quinolinate synthase